MTTLPYECSSCGASARAGCNCGVAYVPAGERAAAAVAANPEKSDRAIAAEIGVSHPTVGKVRKATGKLFPVEKRTGRDGKMRKQPAKRKTDDPKLAALRERAAQHGLRIRKRGDGYATIDADGKSTSHNSDLDVVGWGFDIMEGKMPVRYYSPCGSLTFGDNRAAWLANNPGATMEDFERALSPPPKGCDLDEQTTDDTNSSAEARKAEYTRTEDDRTAVNDWHRKIIGVTAKLDLELRAWTQEHAAMLINNKDARDCLHNALMMSADRLMHLAQEVDGRGAEAAQMAEAA